jgi:ER membrane protein complex subunit 6
VKEKVLLMGSVVDVGLDLIFRCFPETSFNREKMQKEEINLQYNIKIIRRMRAIVSLLSGITAGLLGLTNYSGFLFYLLPSILLSLILLSRTRDGVYFRDSSFVWTFDVFANFPSYLAAWVFTYGICLILL